MSKIIQSYLWRLILLHKTCYEAAQISEMSVGRQDVQYSQLNLLWGLISTKAECSLSPSNLVASVLLPWQFLDYVCTVFFPNIIFFQRNLDKISDVPHLLEIVNCSKKKEYGSCFLLTTWELMSSLWVLPVSLPWLLPCRHLEHDGDISRAPWAFFQPTLPPLHLLNGLGFVVKCEISKNWTFCCAWHSLFQDFMLLIRDHKSNSLICLLLILVQWVILPRLG